LRNFYNKTYSFEFFLLSVVLFSIEGANVIVW